MKLVYGVGVYEDGVYKPSIDKITTKEYSLWRNILCRCYNKMYDIRRVSYKDCTVSDNFKNFQFFAEWCNSQIGFGNEGWHLDKDIILKGNKVYSEDTCVFVPREINSLFISSRASRGDCPVGVSYKKRKKTFQSSISMNGKTVHLGYFKTEIEAFNRYKQEKEKHIKSMAERYKEFISHKAYTALMLWEINKDD